jgi:hypothetical protein
MEWDFITESYVLQPNEVLEVGQLRVTNVSKTAQGVTTHLLKDFDYLKLTTGPIIERGLEFRLRVG